MVYFLPYNNLQINSYLALVFLLFSSSDFFDGYFARRYHQTSLLGALLDPLADKCLLYATLIGLLAAQKIAFYWVIILLGRELLITGLRHIASEHGFTIPVSYAGKVKTMVTTFCFTYIIINPYQQLGFEQAPVWNGIELVLLLATTIISLYSAIIYCLFFIDQQKSIREFKE